MPPLRPPLRQPAASLARQSIDAPPRTGLIGSLLPGAFHQARFFQAIKTWIERPFLEPQRPAAGVFQAPPDLEPVRLAVFEDREGHGRQMSAQRIAADGFHAISLDRLNMLVKARSEEHTSELQSLRHL